MTSRVVMPDHLALGRLRLEAALRLPPLPCGCHDPLTPRHQRGDCRDIGQSRDSG